MKRSELAFTAALVPLDFITLFLAGIAAYQLRFNPFFTEIRPVLFYLPTEIYLRILFPLILLWMVIFSLTHLYSTKRPRLTTELMHIFIACTASMTLVFTILFFSRSVFESRFIVLAAWVCSIVFISIERLLLRGLQRSLLSYGIGTHFLVMIGKNLTAQALKEEFEHKGRLGFRVVEMFDQFDGSTKKKILELKQTKQVEEILLADPKATEEQMMELLLFCDSEHFTCHYAASLLAMTTGKTDISTYAGIPLFEIKKTPLDGWGAIYKRLFDIIISFFLIILTLPLQLIITILLFIEQPGRVLFSRLPNGEKTMRIGQYRIPFHYFKFRSMIKDAHKYRSDKKFIKTFGNERDGSPLFKLKKDPRITKVGKYIRKFSLDELPEFYLVFLGRMSLVGPRPHLPEEVAQYQDHHRRVLNVKPGITGLAQISGRADLQFEDEVRLDIFYIEHWTPWLDLYILLKTPFVVLFRKGAY
ncbi:hypothetical protein CO172_03480 [Candidatus Uhrbacteria bacterium CG_4_9_14_3_um_filter_36_7]|uniref:Bacterial sugar transferase domain-containing protein n=1 Tax=Candidatus Uhrbacteria bacterium CG_4_9_14_3_um_filter_36_7 TaxID=1975033 RepID=A0A2M7XGB7_9BACT|nr:MAG: hypothetical protein CO172_03480 [Candidatus Uhrbacteria bacterium CG_4_9_14_3_um_filter_36_7]